MGTSHSTVEKRHITEFNEQTNEFIHDYLIHHQKITGISSDSEWDAVYPGFYKSYGYIFCEIETFPVDDQKLIYKHLLGRVRIDDTRKNILDKWGKNNVLKFIKSNRNAIDLCTIDYSCVCNHGYRKETISFPSKEFAGCGLYMVLK